MAMGIVSDKDFDKELGNLTPCLPIPCGNPRGTPGDNDRVIAEVVRIERGRGFDNVEVPNSLRQMIGEESTIQGRASALELANNFGISPSSVSAYANGSNSTASMDVQSNLTHINEAKLRVAKKARNRLVMALNSLTQEKIEGAKARDIAGIAKDMSAVIKTMEPESPKGLNGNSGPTFIFYSPQMRTEKVFEVVHVKE
jgi:predicted transcriptional regulator